MHKMSKENPRHHVVSLRVSDDDLSDIKKLLLREQITVSDLLREALQVVRERLAEPERLPCGMGRHERHALRQLN